MWLIVAAGAAEPLFYLLSVGVGIGGLIGTVTGPGGQPVPYREFVAPGLLAVSALNGALNDSTFNIFGRLKFEKLYDAVLATPLGARDVAFAEIGWAVLRGMIYSVTFLIVIAAMGLIASPWALLALPGAGADQLRDRRARGVPHHLHEVLAGLRLRACSSRCRCSCSPARSIRCRCTRTSSAVIVEWTPLYQGVVILRDLVLGRAVARPGLAGRVPARARRRGAGARRPADRQVASGLNKLASGFRR